MPRTKRKRRLLLEALEQRRVMADDIWTGKVNDDWHNPENWSLNAIPANGDVAVLKGGAIRLYEHQTNSVTVRVETGGTILDLNSFAFVYSGMIVGAEGDAIISVKAGALVGPGGPAPNISVGGTDSEANAWFDSLYNMEFGAMRIGGTGDDFAQVKFNNTQAFGGQIIVGNFADGASSELQVDSSNVTVSGLIVVGGVSSAEAVFNYSNVQCGDLIVADGRGHPNPDDMTGDLTVTNSMLTVTTSLVIAMVAQGEV
jgi:hypothetical protein